MCFLSRKPFNGRFTRMMYRRSGLLYLPVTDFFCQKLPDKHTVLMLVDTGTDASVLRQEFVDAYAPNDIRYSKDRKVMTASGTVDVKSLLWIPFVDGNGRGYREDFLVMDNIMSLEELSKETGCYVAGILGTRFMDRYGMIINFKTKRVEV